MNSQAFALELRPPRGPIRPKYELFRWLGEPGWPQNYQECWTIGDVGTGKTSALIDAVFFSLYFYPGARVAVLRSTLTELQAALIPDLQQRLRPLFESGFLEYIRDLNILRAANGSEAHFFGLDTADNKLWGQQWFRAFVDQAERVRPDMLDLLHTRVRQQVKHKDTGRLGATYIKLTANWDRGRDWVYKRVEEGARPLDKNGDIVEKVIKRTVAGKTFESRIIAIHSRTIENEELTEDYYKHLVLAGKLAERAVRGGYDRGDDDHLVFIEYGFDHVTDAVFDVADRPIYVGVDHGLYHPTVFVFFVRDETGTYFPIREYVRRNAPVDHNAEVLVDIIYDLASRGAARFHIYADPSMWRRNAMDAEQSSVAAVYEEAIASINREVDVYLSPAFGRNSELRGVPGVQGSKGTIEFGISVIKSLLRQKKLLVNPKLTPRVDEVLAELTHDDIQRDAMTKVDVFDAMRYALSNARMYDDVDGAIDWAIKARPFTIRRG